MATYLKNGFRKVKVEQKKQSKKDIKIFYSKMRDIYLLTGLLSNHEEKITEDNIQEIVKPIIGRELDQIEKLLVLSKLHEKEINP